MKTLFFLEAKCEHTKKTFYPRYDLAADDCWVLTYGVKSLPEGESSDSEPDDSLNVRDYRIGPQFKCPWCGNDVYVRCGSCKKLTCHKNGDKSFTCANCGKSGEITGSLAAEDVAHDIKGSRKGQ